MTSPVFDAVVLAGGASRRLGTDKALVEVGGRRLLDRVLDAVVHADRTVVVGPHRPVARPVLWSAEDPAGGGPAAGLQAGLALVRAPVVVVLATDLPFIDGDVVGALLAAVQPDGGAVLVDDDGHEQLTAGAWPTSALRRAAVAPAHGRSLRSLLAPLPRTGVGGWSGDRPASLDCDTAADVARAEALV